jgi:hypothetical protein
MIDEVPIDLVDKNVPHDITFKLVLIGPPSKIGIIQIAGSLV